MKTLKQNLLISIGNIYEKANRSKLSIEYFNTYQNDLKVVADYCKITQSQALFFSLIFSLNYKGDTVDFSDMIKYLDCNPTKILEFSDDLEALISKAILETKTSFHRAELTGANNQFTINKKVTDAILANKNLPEDLVFIPKTVYDLFFSFYEKFNEIKNDSEFSNSFSNYVKDVFLSNTEFPVVKEIKKLGLSNVSNTLFILLVCDSLTGKNTLNIQYIFRKAVTPCSLMFFSEKLINEEATISKYNLIRVIKSEMGNNLEIALSTHAISWLKKYGLEIPFFNKKKGNLLTPKQIMPQKLFYNCKEKEQVVFLENLLQNDKFSDIQNRLNSKNLPKGVTVLMYGLPGTGKTETVKQIAKHTNREVMKVDIGNSKSMWFGESEKITKQIFDDYKAIAEECKETPILFFNEADAIFSKRLKIGNSNVAKTENAIQNIILEEMENFEGILMATTNLTDNLDAAFERRFLFKIEFNKPEFKINQKIWEHNFPFLTEKESQKLAYNYQFSGGQISNIKRKAEIKQIIYNEQIKLSSIVQFCNEERLYKQVKKIGF